MKKLSTTSAILLALCALVVAGASLAIEAEEVIRIERKTVKQAAPAVVVDTCYSEQFGCSGPTAGVGTKSKCFASPNCSWGDPDDPAKCHNNTGKTKDCKAPTATLPNRLPTGTLQPAPRPAEKTPELGLSTRPLRSDDL